MSGTPPGKASMLIRKMQFPAEYGLFVAANLLDLFLTMLFIERGAGEANPAASWILLTFGKTGFIAYKVLLMLVVIGLCEAVARKRKILARLLIWFGIVALAVVTITTAMRYYDYMQTPDGGALPDARISRATPVDANRIPPVAP